MKKFKVIKRLGYIRGGHLEGIVTAETDGEAFQKATKLENYELSLVYDSNDKEYAGVYEIGVEEFVSESDKLEQYKKALDKACLLLKRANEQSYKIFGEPLYEEYTDLPENASNYDERQWKEYLLNE